jgi:hypothetical protein
MVRLPLFQELSVLDYGLFPGKPAGTSLRWHFESGLTLITGVNGLGKTTLLTILLRMLAGPFDLTSMGVPEHLEAVLPAIPVGLSPQSLRFFGQRVADGAQNATAGLTAQFANDTVCIQRSLEDLALLSLSINGEPIELPARKGEKEAVYQEKACNLFGLGSFVDVLLILHHVVFFLENRPGALWDENAQRQILRALFLDKETAGRVADFERRVQSADSRARNISARAYNIQKELETARQREAHSPGVRAELEAEQKLLDADMERREELEGTLSELDNTRKIARLEYEKAKLEAEEAEKAVERIKYTSLSRQFPSMEEAARFVFLRILGSGECLVCGADATRRRDELEASLAKGNCPVCGSEPAMQEHVVAVHKVDAARIERARKVAEIARDEEETGRKRLDSLLEEYDGTLKAIDEIRKAIEDRQMREKGLVAQLPKASSVVLDLERMLETTRRSQREAEAEREGAAQELRSLHETGQAAVIVQSGRLSSRFGKHVSALLAEEAQLVRIQGSARLTQAKSDFSVPAFRPEMSAANRAGLARRMEPTDVSESQRELIDLAFRLALIDVATGGKSSSFVMETPEASLDGLAMKRVGSALRQFAQSGENRLVVTSNLTNAGMITAIFGGPTSRGVEVKRRRARLINLLELAAPNKAVERNGKEYGRLLEEVITGHPS